MINKAYVGPFDGELKTIPFNDGDSIQSLFDKANLTIKEGQFINDEDSDEVSLSDEAEADQTYYIVGNFKQGSY